MIDLNKIKTLNRNMYQANSINYEHFEKLKLYLLKALMPIIFILAIAFSLSGASAQDHEITPLPNSFNHLVKKFTPAMVRVEFNDEGDEEISSALPFLDELPMMEGEVLDFEEFSKKTGKAIEKLIPFDKMPFKDFNFKTDVQFTPINTGNGLIISKDGYVITNHYHSFKSSPIIKIYTSNNNVYEGKIVGFDQLSGISLIKITTEKNQEFPFINLSEKTDISLGDWVINIAIMPNGNPLLRSALISNIAESKSSNPKNIENLYIIDRSSIPELTGSPIINMKGQIIGLSTAQPADFNEIPNDEIEQGNITITNLGDSLDISYVQPISFVSKIADELKDKGKIAHGWLGIKIQNITSDLSTALGMSNQNGALVNQVLLDTPAENAGIQLGDVITMINGHNINNTKQLSNIILKLEPGSSADISILRAGQELTKNVKIASLPDDMQSPIIINKTNDIKKYFLENYGLRLQKNKTNETSIKSVKFGSIADRNGLRKGQIIKQADNKQITSIEELYEKITELKKENKKSILILLETNNHFTTFKTLPVK